MCSQYLGGILDGCGVGKREEGVGCEEGLKGGVCVTKTSLSVNRPSWGRGREVACTVMLVCRRVLRATNVIYNTFT